MQTRAILYLVLALCFVGAVLSKSIRKAEVSGELTNINNAAVAAEDIQAIRQKRDDSVSASEESETEESVSEESEDSVSEESEESESEESEESESEESESSEIRSEGFLPPPEPNVN